MKRKLVQLILMITAGVALAVISVLAYSAAWFQADVSHPYTFDILASGVLYVSFDVAEYQSEAPLVPAVAMPGAISQGLPYDVLKTNAQDSNSYISKAATVAPIIGKFQVQNHGWGYENVLLEHDPTTGATLYPKINLDGRVVWIDDSDHSRGYQTMVCYELDEQGVVTNVPITADDYAPKIDEDGKIVWKEGHNYMMAAESGTWSYYYDDSYYVCSSKVLSKNDDGVYMFPLCDVYGNIVWKDDNDHSKGYNVTTHDSAHYVTTGTHYAPLLDENDCIQWTRSISVFNAVRYSMTSADYELEEVPSANVHPAEVEFEIRFKMSNDPDVVDYISSDNFAMTKLVFVTATADEDEVLEERYKTGVGDKVRTLNTLSDDKMKGSFTLHGSEYFFVYAEVYLAQPDELLDPLLRNVGHLYMTVQVDVVTDLNVNP